MKILFLDVDTLRPDHLGCYGYGRRTSPNIDSVAEDGVRFENYFCSDAPCLPSRAALMTGMFGIHNGAVGHGGTAADKRLSGAKRSFRDEVDSNNLHNIFRKAGMYTASVSTFPERHSSYWYTAGLNEQHNVGGGGSESGEEVLPVALDWLDRNRDRENWFLHVHFWDPHTPYRVPESFGNPFENQPVSNWITEDVFNKHLLHTGPHSINEINMYNDLEMPRFPRQPGKIDKYENLKRVFDGYDCGILYADSLIGQITDKLKEHGIYDETAIIISSDHGENMGELGIYSEHATADLPTCRIPMIIKWPRGAKNEVCGGLHYNIDLAPTLAELLNVSKYAKWDGKSYRASVLHGDNTGRESLVISQQAHVCQRSAVFDKWLYIRTIHDGYHLFDREMLFDIKNDPHEQFDLKEKYPEICARGAKIILDWQEQMMLESDSMIDPMWQVMKEGGPFHTRTNLLKYIERLENTGRAEGAKILRDRYFK